MWAHVQNWNARAAGTGGSLSATAGSSVTAGNLVIVGISQYNTGVSSVTDNKSNTYTKATAGVVSTQDVEIWYSYITTGGTGLIITIGGQQYAALSCDEFSGAAGSSVDAVEIGPSEGSTSITISLGLAEVPAAIAVSGNDLVYMVTSWNYGSGVTATAAPGYTLAFDGSFESGLSEGITAIYLMNTTTNPAFPYATLTSPAQYYSAGITFKLPIASSGSGAPLMAAMRASGFAPLTSGHQPDDHRFHGTVPGRTLRRKLQQERMRRSLVRSSTDLISNSSGRPK
jgi:hypothetical protein